MGLVVPESSAHGPLDRVKRHALAVILLRVLKDRPVQIVLRARKEPGQVLKLVEVDLFPILKRLRQVTTGLLVVKASLFRILEQVLANDVCHRVLLTGEAIQLARALREFAVGGETRRVDVLQVDVLLGVVGDLDDVAARHAFADPLAIQDGEIRTTLGGKLGKDLVVPLRGANQVALD